MYRGTTPYFKFKWKEDSVLPGAGINDISVSNILVTFEIKNFELTARESENRVIRTYDEDQHWDGFYVRLTQQETLDMPLGDLSIQVKFFDSNTDVLATAMFKTKVKKALYEEVITL